MPTSTGSTMLTTSSLSTSKLNQAGAAHIAAILLLLLGLLATLYLVQNPTVLNPKADYESDPSSAVFVNGKACAKKICEVSSNEFELTIDVSGLNSQQ